MTRKRLAVYLAGQPNEYDNNWKELFKAIDGCDFYDWEVHSNQTSADTYFPDDLKAIERADILIANPGTAPSEAMWIEVGYFYNKNVKVPGDFCDRLIVIWQESRNPKWSIDFVRKAGIVVTTPDEAIQKLKSIIGGNSNLLSA